MATEILRRPYVLFPRRGMRHAALIILGDSKREGEGEDLKVYMGIELSADLLESIFCELCENVKC